MYKKESYNETSTNKFVYDQNYVEKYGNLVNKITLNLVQTYLGYHHAAFLFHYPAFETQLKYGKNYALNLHKHIWNAIC